MKKIIYAVLATISGLVLLFSYRTSLGESIPDPTDAASTTTTSGSTTSRSGSASGSGLTDGAYTGQAVNTRFGPVQVAITVSGGTIADVTVPEYPSSNGRDRQINDRALPRLVSETLSAQSSSIDMVSGATYTSQGYLQSLQSAIDQASS